MREENELNMNEIKIEGNLVRDAQIKYTTTGKMVCSFSIAYNHTKEMASFFDIETWEDIAKKCEQLRKGECVLITGYLKQERWQDKTDGKQRSKIKIVAKEFGIIKNSARTEQQQEHYESFTSDIPF
jgi:single-strand DNA-binding protein